MPAGPTDLHRMLMVHQQFPWTHSIQTGKAWLRALHSLHLQLCSTESCIGHRCFLWISGS